MLKNLTTGLYETHLNVTDLERSMIFYDDGLGLELGAVFGKKGDERHMAFYWVGGSERAMLGIWEREPVFSQHFAFKVELENFKSTP
jgi:catechol 2,3-dioxygenase-like lactoylglutathione lyase family enzyme